MNKSWKKEQEQPKHRRLAMFLAVRAWKSGHEAVELTRQHVQRYLDIEDIRRARLEWLKRDFRPWWPESEMYERRSGGFHSFVFARSRPALRQALESGSYLVLPSDSDLLDPDAVEEELGRFAKGTGFPSKW